MQLPGVDWSLILLLCLLCWTEGAILRPYRLPCPLLASTDPAAYKKTEDCLLSENLSSPVVPIVKSNFKPSQKRCCQIGERVAKKMMVCDITMLAVVRKYNYERQRVSNQYSNRPRKHIRRRRQNKLSEKVAICSAAFPKYFTKCCAYKAEFYKHIKKCHRKPRRQRRRCKQIIRKKYS